MYPHLAASWLRYDIFNHLSVKLYLKVLLAIFCYYFVLMEIFFCTFRELGTSIFALNDINKRKYGVSKLGFISYDYVVTLYVEQEILTDKF